MGSPAQQPVYYDTESSQYYTVKPQQNNQNGYLGAFPGSPFSQIPNSQNPFYASQMKDRNYLGNPYSSSNLNRFKTNAQATPYAELTNLFPGLNAGLSQGLMSPTQTDGAMYGAGRFLAPQTTSESKGK